MTLGGVGIAPDAQQALPSSSDRNAEIPPLFPEAAIVKQPKGVDALGDPLPEGAIRGWEPCDYDRNEDAVPSCFRQLAIFLSAAAMMGRSSFGIPQQERNFAE